MNWYIARVSVAAAILGLGGGCATVKEKISIVGDLPETGEYIFQYSGDEEWKSLESAIEIFLHQCGLQRAQIRHDYVMYSTVSRRPAQVGAYNPVDYPNWRQRPFSSSIDITQFAFGIVNAVTGTEEFRAIAVRRTDPASVEGYKSKIINALVKPGCRGPRSSGSRL